MRSFADPSDAERIKVPACLLPSSAEDMDVVRPSATFLHQRTLIVPQPQMNKLYAGIEAKNPGKNVMKHYPDQVHGFLAARADVSSAPVPCLNTRNPADRFTAQRPKCRQGLQRGVHRSRRVLQGPPLSGNHRGRRNTCRSTSSVNALHARK